VERWAGKIKEIFGKRVGKGKEELSKSKTPREERRNGASYRGPKLKKGGETSPPRAERRLSVKDKSKIARRIRGEAALKKKRKKEETTSQRKGGINI